MRVLICDDEPAARYVAKRLLTTLLGCSVVECSDGVQALEALAQRRFEAAIVDLDLPGLSGVEVVESIRASEALREFPIVVVSEERRASVVRTLADLGVAAYLLKPLRKEAVLGRLAPIFDRVRSQPKPAGERDSRAVLAPGEAMLLVDGDPNFSCQFAQVATPFGPVMTAESAAAALVRFRRAPVDVVFVGQSLGLVSAPNLVTKLREARPDVFVVGVGHGDAEATIFDATISRSFLPAVLTDELSKFAPQPGLLDALEALAPGIGACVRSAVHQALGTVAALECADASVGHAVGTDVVVSTVAISIDGRTSFDLDLVVSVPVAEALAAQVLECPASAVTADARQSTIGELANIVSGRLNAWLNERGLPCTCQSPQTRPTTLNAAAPTGAGGTAWHFTVPALQQAMSVWVRAVAAVPVAA